MMLVIGAVAAAMCLSLRAHADHAPVVVIPGRAYIPVIVNGVDIGGAVIEGDWGLHRPGALAPRIIGRVPLLIGRRPGAGYYPATGQRPRVGRHERQQARRPPVAVERYHRSWSTDPVPTYRDPPPVIDAPELGGPYPYRGN
jgi:hypothetical protein